MFNFSIEETLQRKIKKLKKKDRILVQNFKKKFQEVINNDRKSIHRYKNLRSPMHEYKRIHLTDNYILLFKVDIDRNHIVFMDILHWDIAYKK